MKKDKWYKKIWDYWRPMWEGTDGKPSVRSGGAIALLVAIITQCTNAFYKWEAGKSLSDAAILVGVEMGGLLALLGIQTYGNIKNKQIDKGQPNTPVTVTNAETVNVDNTTKSAE